MSQPSAQAQTSTPECPTSTSTSTDPGPTPIPDMNATSSCDQAPVGGAGGASGASGSSPDTVTGTLVGGTTIFFGTTTPSLIGPRGASSLAVPGQELYCTPDGNGGYECPYATSTSSTSTSGASGTAGGGASGASSHSGSPDRFARASHYLDCDNDPCERTESTGASEVWVNLSLREPRLRYDHQSWENYHYYNRVHVGHPGKPMNCPDGTPTYEFISVGFAKGQFVRNTFDNEIIIEAFYHAPASPDGLTPAQTLCQEIRTGIKAVDSTALTFKVHWSSDYGMGGHWLNGAWHVDVWRGRWDNLGDTSHFMGSIADRRVWSGNLG